MASRVVIIDYGSGNLHSVQKAFERVADGEVILTSNPDDLKAATHIVLPGVGAFGDCAKGLRALAGMVEELEVQVLQNKKPFLGICVGMQLLADKGLEHGEHKGLGWISGEVVKMQPKGDLAVPHMGWNNIKLTDGLTNSQPLIDSIDAEDFYFVHSYYFKCSEDAVIATVNYGGEMTAIVNKDNIQGVQFHPEKSQQAGLKLIENFVKR